METAGAKEMPEDAGNGALTQAQQSGLRGEKEGQRNGADARRQAGAAQWSLSRRGLGTPATRAGILEKLVSTGMLERRKMKKQTILVPTALGNALITVLPEQLQSPLLTAEWEHRLSQVQKDELEPEDFLDGIRDMLIDLVAHYRPISGADILFPSAENTVGKCPRCGRPVIERSKGFFCTNQDCKFVLWRDSRFFTLKQKTLDKHTAQLLMEKGRAPLKGCVSSKTGNVYDAIVILEDDGERAHFKLVFPNG